MMKLLICLFGFLSAVASLEVIFIRENLWIESDANKNHLLKLSKKDGSPGSISIEWLKDITKSNMQAVLEIDYHGQTHLKRNAFSPCDHTSAHDMGNFGTYFLNRIFLGKLPSVGCPISVAKKTIEVPAYISNTRQSSIAAACVEKLSDLSIKIYEKDPKGGSLPGSSDKGWTNVATALYKGKFLDC